MTAAPARHGLAEYLTVLALLAALAAAGAARFRDRVESFFGVQPRSAAAPAAPDAAPR
jgi:hypothetical protein